MAIAAAIDQKPPKAIPRINLPPKRVAKFAENVTSMLEQISKKESPSITVRRFSCREKYGSVKLVITAATEVAVTD
jgi:hypothetical protein